MRRRTAAVATGALALAAWASPAGAAESTDEARTDYTFTARDGEELTCTLVGNLLVGRSSEPPFVDLAGATQVSGPQACHDALIDVGVLVEYTRDDEEARDSLSSSSQTGPEARVSARLWGATVRDVRGSHGAAFLCLIEGHPLICAPQVHTAVK